MSDSPNTLLPRLCVSYLDELAHQRRLSVHTVSNYQRDLILLHRLAVEKDAALTPLSLSNNDIRRFIMQLHSRNLASRSIARTLSAWRSYFRWLGQRGEMTQNPALGIRPPKANKPLPKTLSVDEMALLLSDTGTISTTSTTTKVTTTTTASETGNTATGANDANALFELRDMAMFELFYSSGLRLAELAALNLECMQDIEHGEVRVFGKRGKWRVVPVGELAVRALHAWCACRSVLANSDELALFVGARGRRIHPRVIELQLKKHALQKGLLRHVHPHMLRHSFASHLLQASGDLRAVQEMLGHASIASTQIYTHLDFQHLAKIYDAAHPHAKRK